MYRFAGVRQKTNVVVLVAVLCFYGAFTKTVLAQQEHADKDKFHADLAHSLLEMNTALDMIEAYRAQGEMPPDSDARHEKAAHGFKHALELFGVKTKM